LLDICFVRLALLLRKGLDERLTMAGVNAGTTSFATSIASSR
jgi:hypothetical protein